MRLGILVGLCAALLLVSGCSKDSQTASGDSAPGDPVAGTGGSGFPQGAAAVDPDALFKERDINNDGQLSGDEISARMRGRLVAYDADQDGAISREEYDALMLQSAAGQGAGGEGRGGGRRGGGRGGGGGGGGRGGNPLMAAIREMGGNAMVDHGEILAVELHSDKANNEGLGKLTALKSVAMISLKGPNFTNDALAHLPNFKSLQVVALHGPEFSTAGLEHLVGLDDLQTIEMTNVKLDDSRLSHLAKMKNLQNLDLRGVAVEDADLEHLRDLNDLRTVKLIDTAVTDAGIKMLETALPDTLIQTSE